MAKLEVKPDTYLDETVARLPDGLLLASLDPQGQPNAMAIGWATLGIVWSRPMFVALVRHSRYTFRDWCKSYLGIILALRGFEVNGMFC